MRVPAGVACVAMGVHLIFMFNTLPEPFGEFPVWILGAIFLLVGRELLDEKRWGKP